MVSGSFSAGCLEWPRAVSGCLAPAATFFHRPGDWVLHARALRATSAKQVHADLRPNVECGDQSPTDEWIDVTPVVHKCQVDAPPSIHRRCAHRHAVRTRCRNSFEPISVGSGLDFLRQPLIGTVRSVNLLRVVCYL
jgi:hypothetical protein